MAIYYTVRNSELVRIKNVPIPIFMRCFPKFIIGMLREFIYFAIKHKNLAIYLIAKRDTIRLLPKMLRKRAMVMKNKKVSNRYLLNMMTPVWERDFIATKIKKVLYA
jgi:hypothetical protein